jgi:TolA-binding protein
MRKYLIVIALLSGVGAAPVLAQSDVFGLRVDKLEREMKAVQRKVFPNGAALEPELGGSPKPATAPGTAASAPLTDLNARIDALESQLKSLTGQVEQDGFRLKKLEEGLKAQEARLKALEPAAEVSTKEPEAVEVAMVKPEPPKPVPSKVTAIAKPASPKVTPPPVSTKIDPARKTALAAVEIPSSGDAAEDTYAYGYRLWQAKLYPEAQTKLKEFMAKYATHKKASFAQNLLGRAYLDEGKPALASVAFYDNYQKMPRGERAAESLYWLGVSLTRLKKPADACKVYSEFDEVYAPKAPADLKARVTKGKTDAKCAAA